MNPLKKLSDWYFSRKVLSYWCILVMDCAAVYVSGLFVYYLQHGGVELAQHFWQVTFGLGVCLIVYIIAFVAFHTFHGVMRYSSFVDLHRVAYSTAIAGVGVWGHPQSADPDSQTRRRRHARTGRPAAGAV